MGGALSVPSYGVFAFLESSSVFSTKVFVCFSLLDSCRSLEPHFVVLSVVAKASLSSSSSEAGRVCTFKSLVGPALLVAPLLGAGMMLQIGLCDRQFVIPSLPVALKQFDC